MEEQMSINDEEFLDPNRNFTIVMIELRQRIERLQLDILHITDEELKGIAVKMYTDLRLKYFDMMSKDLQLQFMYKDEDEEVDDNV